MLPHTEAYAAYVRFDYGCEDEEVVAADSDYSVDVDEHEVEDELGDDADNVTVEEGKEVVGIPHEDRSYRSEHAVTNPQKISLHDLEAVHLQ